MKAMTLVSALMLVLALSAFAMPRQSNQNDQAQLQKEADISMQQAEQTALQKEPGKIKSKELERENGKLIYSFDVKTKSGIHEVNVDATNGKVVEDSVESKSAEFKEKQQDTVQNSPSGMQNPSSNPHQ